MSNEHLSNVNFDFIRYANCWEDADVLVEGLEIQSNSQIMSIASAGDNCLALLSRSPEKVVAVDISPVQLFLMELKKIVIREFDYEDFLGFLGFKHSTRRVELYQSIKNNLSNECRGYWDTNLNYIETGVIHEGKFEKYFQLFKNKVLPTVHDRPIVDELFAEKSAGAQKQFHDEKWHTPAWSKMYRQFFGVEMMGSQGRDPEFLKHVTGSVPDLILEREMAHLSKKECQKNYFLYYILYNEFHTDFLPLYAREENFLLIRNNLDALVQYKGLLDSAMDVHPNCTHFNLSDIFEYMDQPLFRTVAEDLLKKSAPAARFAYWNLLIPRYISKEFPDKAQHLTLLSETLKARDMGYFYGDLVFEEKLT